MNVIFSEELRGSVTLNACQSATQHAARGHRPNCNEIATNELLTVHLSRSGG